MNRSPSLVIPTKSRSAVKLFSRFKAFWNFFYLRVILSFRFLYIYFLNFTVSECGSYRTKAFKPYRKVGKASEKYRKEKLLLRFLSNVTKCSTVILTFAVLNTQLCFRNLSSYNSIISSNHFNISYFDVHIICF